MERLRRWYRVRGASPAGLLPAGDGTGSVRRSGPGRVQGFGAQRVAVAIARGEGGEGLRPRQPGAVEGFEDRAVRAGIGQGIEAGPTRQQAPRRLRLGRVRIAGDEEEERGIAVLRHRPGEAPVEGDRRIERRRQALGTPRLRLRQGSAGGQSPREAERQQAIFGAFRKDLYALGYPPALVKRALYLMDASVGASRQPALLPDPAQDAQIDAILRRYELSA